MSEPESKPEDNDIAVETGVDDTEEQQTEPEPEYIIVMDSFGGDWTPIVAMTDANEAIRLREMLEADADGACATAPYYATREDARDGITSIAPQGLEELVVAFSGKDVIAISENKWATREAQINHGGLRAVVDVYDTADEVAVKKPSVVGEFIVSQLTADDILNAIR